MIFLDLLEIYSVAAHVVLAANIEKKHGTGVSTTLLAIRLGKKGMGVDNNGQLLRVYLPEA